MTSFWNAATFEKSARWISEAAASANMYDGTILMKRR